MSSSCYSICVAVLLVVCMQGVFIDGILLAPSSVDVIEKSSVTFTCTATGNVSGWTLSDVWAFIAIASDDTCQATGFINEKSLYSWNCHRNGSFSLTLIKVDRNRHGEKWVCRQGLITISNEVVINVRVPVERIEINSPRVNTVSMIENQFKWFKCNTSYSRPTPSVKWFIRIEEKTSQINATISVVIISDEKGFTSAQSILYTSVSREEQGAVIYCTGTNGLGAEVVSRTITINVYYSPEGGPYINEASNNSIYTLKEGRTANITCISPLGNPPPKLSWNCSGLQTNSYEDKREIRLSLTWKTNRDEDKVCRCTSEQVIAGIKTAFIKTVVLYPPIIGKIKFSHTDLSQNIQVDKTIHVIENEKFTLICEARSKPEPIYKWTGATNSNTSSIMIINPLKRKNYTETCHVTNIMKFSNGDQRTVSVNKSVNVDILYPPEIIQMSGKRVIEGSSLKLSCLVKNGNPAVTRFSWTREVNDKQWLQQSFMMKNISRNDSMRYTCVASNTMVMTGNIVKTGSENQNVNLEALYPPHKPTMFLISLSNLNVDMTINNNFTVVENMPFTLSCKASSLPKPNYYSWSHDTVLNSSIFKVLACQETTKKEVTCIVSNTMVSSDGILKQGESNRTVTIDIQFSPGIGSIYDISSEVGTTVNFSCPIIYGNPKRTTVMWIRRGDRKQWNGANFALENVSRTDSTLYTCRVNNTFVMTGGFLKEGKQSKSIELNVLYKANILNYVAVNLSDNDNVTVAENREVNLTCIIEGNPSPEGRIFSQSQFEIEKNVIERYVIVSATFSATCFHNGIYSCSGFNVLNQKHISERNITLYVTCSPRPNPSAPLKKRIKTNKALIVNFTVLAYPEPSNVYISKYNGQSWKAINGRSNFEITSIGLDVNFTIHRVSEEDYGKYNFTITNELGMYEHVFYVEPAEMFTPSKNLKSAVNYVYVVGLPLVITIIISVVAAGVILYRKGLFPNVGITFGKKEENIEPVPSNLYQNLTDSRAQNNKSENEYEKIQMNQEAQDKEDYEKYKSELPQENESTTIYQKLNTERKDTNLYNQLHTSRKTEDENETGEKLEEEKESAIYINMKIEF